MKGTPRVLIADRWKTWVQLFTDLLADGFDVVSVSTLQEASSKIWKSASPFHVVITDIQFTADPSHDLDSGQHTLLDEVRTTGAYTKPIVVVSQGPTQRQVMNVVESYDLDRYYLDKYPKDDEVFDWARFRETVKHAASEAIKEEKEALQDLGYEQLQRLSREHFSVLPEFHGSPDPALCLVLLPASSASRWVHRQVALAVPHLQQRYPNFKCRCIPYDIERERKNIWPVINEAGLVVADFTGSDPSVFYELGLCDAVGKQLLLLNSGTEDIPHHFQAFSQLQYVVDEWKIQNLAAELRSALERYLKVTPTPRSLGRRRWRLDEIETHLALMLPYREDAQLAFYQDFVRPILELRQCETKELRDVFGSHRAARDAWFDINRGGIIIADVSTADPETLYALGLAHAQERPVILLKSNKTAMPTSLKGLDCFEYSLEWDQPTIDQKRDELDAMIGGMLSTYNASEMRMAPQDSTLTREYRARESSSDTPSSSVGVERFTWLHLSDLHFEATVQREFEIDEVVKALQKDLKRLREDYQGLKPDAVFFTGDLAYKAKPDEFAKAFEMCLNPILEECGLKPSDLFIVPGNHDVDRSQTTKIDVSIVRQLDRASDIHALLNDSLQAGYRQQLLQRMETYKAAVGSITGLPFDAEALSWGCTLESESGHRIGVIGLNSVWTSASVKGSDGEVDDQGKLIVGRTLIQAALEQIEGSEPKTCIALMHHPISWLQYWDEQDIRRVLREKCRFVLHGHVHETTVGFPGDPNPDTMVISAGALFKKYDQKDFHTCLHAYNIMQLDLASSKGTIYFRRFDPVSGRYGMDDTTFEYVRNGQYSFQYREGSFGPDIS